MNRANSAVNLIYATRPFNSSLYYFSCCKYIKYYCLAGASCNIWECFLDVDCLYYLITLLSVLSLSLILGKGLHLDMQAERASRHKDFQKFLQHIAYGEQDEAEALLKATPELVYGRGNVTDYSQRSFKRVTAFQYAVWALDWHMWSMLRRYLPDAAAAEQLRDWKAAPQQCEPGSWHYSFRRLLEAYKTYQDNYDHLYRANDKQELKTLWGGGVGEEQRLSPAHVLLEYTTSSRPLSSVLDFSDSSRPQVDLRIMRAALLRRWASERK